jgi:hypothetical protein
MRNQVLNVNTDAIIHLTAKLERLNKYAFPATVRSTLNDAGFQMKKKEILDSAKLNMTVRNPSFFRKFTGVKRAVGKDINSMYAEVGFKNTDPNPIKGKKAIVGMEHNEVGGSDNEGSMYMEKSRTANSRDRLVKRKGRFNKTNLVKGRVRSKKSVSNTMNMISSFEEKKPTFIKTKKGTFLVQVTDVRYNMGTKKNDFKLDFLMRSRKLNVAKARATHFVKESAIKTSKQMELFYAKNSQYHFNKVLKSKI